MREEGGVDEIHLVTTEFVSMLTQRPVVRRLLPLEIEDTEEEQPVTARCRRTSSSPGRPRCSTP